MNVHFSNSQPAQRGRPQSPETKQRILDAALRVFAERGYHGTAVPLIARAGRLSTGTLYRYFRSKRAIVNEVYLVAKSTLGAVLFNNLDRDQPAHDLFMEIWRRAARFAREHPLAFRFLEMQDHTEYLDRKSQELEKAVLGPLWLATVKLPGRHALAPEIIIPFVWGALVGLFKAQRLGYIALSETQIERAGQACWLAINSNITRDPKDKDREREKKS
jgi:AcrR family transcriptional regulator